MNCLDILVETMAEANIDIAVDYLKNLINKKITGTHKTYASNIDAATSFIHCRVWADCEPSKRVKKNLIPLIQRASESMFQNYPSQTNKYANHVKENINLRIENLRRYCEGLSSEMLSPQEINKLEKLAR